MLERWIHDLESLEEISQNDEARQLFLRMAAMSQAGQMGSFIAELDLDPEIDEEMKGTLTEFASDTSFLLAVESYLRQTQVMH